MALDRVAQDLAALVQQAQTVKPATAPSGGRAGTTISLRIQGRAIRALCLASIAPGPVVAVLAQSGWACLPVAATRLTGVRQVEFRQRRDGAVVSGGIKILMIGPDGWYIGGDRAVPALIAPFSNDTYQNISLAGITSTGPGLNNWIVSGDGATQFTGGLNAEADAVFYTPAGLVFSQRWLALGGGGLQTYAGHFASFYDNPTITSTRFRWKTPINVGSSVAAGSIAASFGYVLPGVLAGVRLDTVGDFVLRQVACLEPNNSHAVIVGNRPGTDGTVGNPWLVTAAGSFTRLDADLNVAIAKSDLVNLTLYEKSRSFYFSNFASAGVKTLEITPHRINALGAVTTGTPFSVNYYEYDPALYSPVDASYHP